MSAPETPSTPPDKPPLDEGPPSPELVTPGSLADATPSRFQLQGRSLREHAARGTITNGFFLVALSSLALFKGFVLAHFLSRADYGVWGILAVSLISLLWLKQVGIGDKYIQQDDEDQELAFQKAFTLEFIFTMIWVGLLLAVLPVVVIVYGEPKLLLPGLVLILTLPAGVLQTPLWVYYRRMQFFKQRVLQGADPLIGSVVAIGLAAAGAGYWAIPLGVLAGAWSAAAVALVYSPFKLRFRYDRGTMRKYLSFSWPLLVAGIASTVIPQAATLSVQAELGLAAVGALTLAATITDFTNRVDYVITGTLYPAICAVKDRTELLFESFVKSNRLALMWAVPFGFALTLFCSDLVHYGIGDKWRPAIILLQVFGISAAINHVGFNWDAYFRARGETRPMAVAAVVAAAVFLVTGLPLLFTYGLRGLAVGVAAQGIAHLLCRGYFLHRLFDGFGFALHAMRAALPTIPAIAFVIVMRLAENRSRTLGIALIELCGYFAITVIVTWLLEGRLLREAAGYLIARRPAQASG
jgi:O-antigen/teichoic acid export membrane protein